jgi:YD repeat-containing protein
VVPPEGIGRTWTYFPNGLLETETHPESGTTEYHYTAGVLTRTVDARGLDDPSSGCRSLSVRSIGSRPCATYDDHRDRQEAARGMAPRSGISNRQSPEEEARDRAGGGSRIEGYAEAPMWPSARTWRQRLTRR